MEFERYIYYFFVVLTILPAITVPLVKNMLYAALLLMLSFFGVAGLYVFWGAEFVGITQIMVYVGGVVVLIVFAIMFTREKGQDIPFVGHTNKVLGFVAFLVVGYFLIYLFRNLQFGGSPDLAVFSTKETGKLLMTDFILPFEIAGIVLLVALIGSVMIAGEKIKKER
ncbi:MAG: NADH-quinone oxidoreductase subunit J [Cyclobacteriaceae bacterium]|nr:NADH-quinone oxidoreductase subunit J [Cyclobacteriaceae bacterium]